MLGDAVVLPEPFTELELLAGCEVLILEDELAAGLETVFLELELGCVLTVEVLLLVGALETELLLAEELTEVLEGAA